LLSIMRKTIICIDRDGTLIHDTRDHLFLGRNNDWKSKVKLLPFVVDGIKLMNAIPYSSIYMITNQPGVAINDYPLLTVDRAREVCRYVFDIIKSKGAVINDFFLCPHADFEYIKTKPNAAFNKNLVHENCGCLKPSLGMVFNALKTDGTMPENADLYVIGDRSSDVQTALNINGTGILIPFKNEPGEEEKLTKLENQADMHISSTLLEAAKFIHSRVKTSA